MALKRRRTVVLSLVAVLLCAVAVAAAASLTATRPEPLDQNLAAKIPPPAQYQFLRVSILGDSLSVGVGASNLDGYAKRLANALCWNLDRVAETGTGYVNPGPTGDRPYTNSARLAAVWGTGPELVIVQGSTNDVGRAGVGEAAVSAYAAIKVNAPKAKLVVVGPTSPPSLDAADVRRTRDELRSAALQAGATFIDPVEQGWLGEASMYGDDQVLPNDIGYRQLTEDLRTAILASGVLQRDSCAPTNR